MAKGAPKNVDEYVRQQAEPTREALEKVRAAIRRALPHAEEVISYKMAAYRLNGKVVLYFAGWKEHYSVYPAGERVMREMESELAPYDVRRGTIRFPLGKPVPAKLIEKIAKLREDEVLRRS